MSTAVKLTAKTVTAAFDEFSKNIVDLDPDDVDTARSSRKWLVSQIESFVGSVDGFPAIYTEENDVQMGSFSRRTKTRPLDDIDFMVVFSAQGSTYNKGVFDGAIHISVPESAKSLRSLCDEYGELNSRKLIEKLKGSLSGVPQYSKADIHRNLEAVTLKLKSYDWVFDIVPAFLTKAESDGRTYYLIPDGNGKWKKTDPRIDAKRATDVNQKLEGKLLKIIRMIKYWNKNGAMPSIPSYLLENIALNYFDGVTKIYTTQSALKDFFVNLQSAIYCSCPDPKGIQGDLNQLDWATKNKIAEAAKKAAQHAQNAINFTIDRDHESAINEWISVFRGDFPTYG